MHRWRRERRFRERRISLCDGHHIVPSPDGQRFVTRCLIGLPLSVILWWLVPEAARAMI